MWPVAMLFSPWLLLHVARCHAIFSLSLCYAVSMCYVLRIFFFPSGPPWPFAFPPGPPWPLTSCGPLPCCSPWLLLHMARCHAIFSLSLCSMRNFLSRVSIRPFRFSSPWLLLFLLPLFLSRRDPFARARINGSVLFTLPSCSTELTGCYPHCVLCFCRACCLTFSARAFVVLPILLFCMFSILCYGRLLLRAILLFAVCWFHLALPAPYFPIRCS